MNAYFWLHAWIPKKSLKSCTKVLRFRPQRSVFDLLLNSYFKKKTRIFTPALSVSNCTELWRWLQFILISPPRENQSPPNSPNWREKQNLSQVLFIQRTSHLSSLDLRRFWNSHPDAETCALMPALTKILLRRRISCQVWTQTRASPWTFYQWTALDVKWYWHDILYNL